MKSILWMLIIEMFSVVIQRCMWYPPYSIYLQVSLESGWDAAFSGTDDGVCMCVCVCVCVFFGGKELYLAVIWSWEVGKKCNFKGAGAAKSPRGKWGRLLRKHSFSSCKTWCKLSTSWQQAKLYSLAKYLGILRILSSYLSEARFKSRSVWLPNLVHFSVRLFTWINL